MQPENPIPQPSRGPTGVVPPGTPEQNPKVITPQVSPEAPPSSPQTPPPLPPAPGQGSRRRAIIIAVVVLLALVAAAVLITLAVANPAKKNTAKPKTSAASSKPAKSSSKQPSYSYSSSQKYARDTKRRSDVLSLQTQLEAYFQNNGYYPSLTDMNSASWRSANMKSLDPGALADPLSSCDPFKTKTGCLVASPKAKAYSYAVTNSAGKSCEANDQTCAKYKLTATLEYTAGGTFSKTNLD